MACWARPKTNVVGGRADKRPGKETIETGLGVCMKRVVPSFHLDPHQEVSCHNGLCHMLSSTPGEKSQPQAQIGSKTGPRADHGHLNPFHAAFTSKPKSRYGTELNQVFYHRDPAHYLLYRLIAYFIGTTN